MTRGMRARRDEHGAAAVETAICLCFIVLPLTFAVISYAFLLSFRQSMSQAAAEGARSAAVALSSTDDATRMSRARTSVSNALGGLVGGHTCGDGKLVCTVSFATCAGSTARCATVRVEYPYRSNPLVPSVPLLGFTLPQTVHYQAVAEIS